MPRGWGEWDRLEPGAQLLLNKCFAKFGLSDPVAKVAPGECRIAAATRGLMEQGGPDSAAEHFARRQHIGQLFTQSFLWVYNGHVQLAPFLALDDHGCVRFLGDI